MLILFSCPSFLLLKRQARTKNGERYEYWDLARTVRTASGPQHETVAYLGNVSAHPPTAPSAGPEVAVLRVVALL